MPGAFIKFFEFLGGRLKEGGIYYIFVKLFFFS